MSETVARIRVRFAKEDAARFISHLDLAHAMERCARRARLPLAFSEGFHPMPKISFAAALAVGATSECEFADFELAEPLSADETVQRLREALPPGLRLIEAVGMPAHAKALQAVVNLAEYQVRPVFVEVVTSGQLSDAVSELAAHGTLPSQRATKIVDIRPYLMLAEVVNLSTGVGLHFEISTGPSGSAKPEEYLKLLPWEANAIDVHRTGLFVFRDGEKLSPLAVAR